MISSEFSYHYAIMSNKDFKISSCRECIASKIALQVPFHSLYVGDLNSNPKNMCLHSIALDSNFFRSLLAVIFKKAKQRC